MRKTPFVRIDKLSNMLDKSQEEIDLCGKFSHPNVAKSFIAFESGETPNEGKVYLMMQCADLGQIATAT